MRADSIRIESEEDGFHLIVECVGPPSIVGHQDTSGAHLRFDFNIHAVAPELFEQVKGIIGEWMQEREDVRLKNFYVAEALAEPYDQDDPKHRDWHSIRAEIYDLREGQ